MAVLCRPVNGRHQVTQPGFNRRLVGGLLDQPVYRAAAVLLNDIAVRPQNQGRVRIDALRSLGHQGEKQEIEQPEKNKVQDDLPCQIEGAPKAEPHPDRQGALFSHLNPFPLHDPLL